MAWTSTLIRLALTILLASSAEISAQQQFGAPVALFHLPGSSPSGPTFFPVVGDHGWNVASDPALLQKWSAEKLQQIKRGDVLVFTSSPGTQHSVRVSTSTAGDITQGSVSCTSKLAAVDTGTNRFTSNVSLVILQTNVTYVVTSSQRDCQQGLAFFFVVPPDPSQLQTYYVHRDVGVAYNLGYTNAGSESPVTSFGNLVPSQSGAYIYHEPGYSRKFFNGDLLNMELPGAYQVNVYTTDDSPASPSNFKVSTSFKGADNALTCGAGWRYWKSIRVSEVLLHHLHRRLFGTKLRKRVSQCRLGGLCCPKCHITEYMWKKSWSSLRVQQVLLHWLLRDFHRTLYPPGVLHAGLLEQCSISQIGHR